VDFVDDRREKLLQDLLNLVELSGEEVVSALHPVNLFGLGERVIELRNLEDWAEFIARSLENQFGFADTMEKIEVEMFTGTPRPTRVETRESVAPTARPTHDPKENPMRHTGNPGKCAAR
jgi:hypothetical protein